MAVNLLEHADHALTQFTRGAVTTDARRQFEHFGRHHIPPNDTTPGRSSFYRPSAGAVEVSSHPAGLEHPYNKPSPAWCLKNLCVPDVTPQRVHALVPRLIGHLEDRGAERRAAGQEASSQRVTSKLLGIESGPLGVRLHDVGNSAVGQPRCLYGPAFGDRPEYGPSGDTGSPKLRLQGGHRASDRPQRHSPAGGGAVRRVGRRGGPAVL